MARLETELVVRKMSLTTEKSKDHKLYGATKEAKMAKKVLHAMDDGYFDDFRPWLRERAENGGCPPEIS